MLSQGKTCPTDIYPHHEQKNVITSILSADDGVGTRFVIVMVKVMMIVMVIVMVIVMANVIVMVTVMVMMSVIVMANVIVIVIARCRQATQSSGGYTEGLHPIQRSLVQRNGQGQAPLLPPSPSGAQTQLLSSARSCCLSTSELTGCTAE